MPWRICLLGVIAAMVAGSARADAPPWATTGFGSGGVAVVEDGNPIVYPQAVAVAPDGSVVVAGGAPGASVELFRLSADGRRIGFGLSGTPRRFSTGVPCRRPGLAVRHDGTIVVACGELVAALRPNGEIRSVTNIAGAELDVVALDEIGNTVAAGNVLVRVRADGGVDPSFKRMTLPQTADALMASGGRYLVAAGGSVLAYDWNGSLDSTWGDHGVGPAPPGFKADSITYQSGNEVQPDGWILAGGSIGDKAAIVRFLIGGGLDTEYGSRGIASWDPANGDVAERVVAVAAHAGGALDALVDGTAAFDRNLGVAWEDWLVQRVTSTGALGDSGEGPSQFIDPTDECVQQSPLAIAEQLNGKTVVAGVACADRIDGNQVSVVMRYDAQLNPDFGDALKIAARGSPKVYGRTITLRVGINGPARIVARLRVLHEGTAVRAPLRLLGSSRISGHRVPSDDDMVAADVTHGPVSVVLRLRPGELLRPDVHYGIAVSAFDSRGYSVRLLARLR